MRWDKNHFKFLSRLGDIRSLNMYLQDRVRACRSLVFSVLSFRALLTSPTPSLLRSHSAAISSVMVAPVCLSSALVVSQTGRFWQPLRPTRRGDHSSRRSDQYGTRARVHPGALGPHRGDAAQRRGLPTLETAILGGGSRDIVDAG